MDKRTLVPPYDPDDLAVAIGSAAPRPGMTEGPFDPGAYARIVADHVSLLTPKDTSASRETMPVPAPAFDVDPARCAPTEAPQAPGIDPLARAMYASYLASDYPEALTLAKRIIAAAPDHAPAQAVASRCRAVLGHTGAAREASSLELAPSSVLRPREEATTPEGLPADARTSVVLQHLDGVSDAATVADLAGISSEEALERLHDLLEAGVVELIA